MYLVATNTTTLTEKPKNDYVILTRSDVIPV